jgi:serine/threonine protein kinase
LSEKKIWEMFFQIVAGLADLHSNNIFHWDLKSANIFLTKRGVKIGDLNVAKESINGLLYT